MSTSVEIILKKYIEGLGEEGEIKKVKMGFARNFLIPKKLAVYKSPYSLERLKKEMEAILKKRKERYEATKNIIEKLNALKIVFKERVSTSGNLFRSIGKNEIFEYISNKFPDEVEKYRLFKTKIHLDYPLKKLGQYTVDFAIYKDSFAKLNVHIVNFEDEENEKIQEEKSQENQQSNLDNQINEQLKEKSKSNDQFDNENKGEKKEDKIELPS